MKSNYFYCALICVFIIILMVDNVIIKVNMTLDGEVIYKEKEFRN